MSTREALEQSFRVFNLKASDIAHKADISPELISRFRHGKGITVDTLDKIVQAMPPTARAYFCASLMTGDDKGAAN